MSVAKEGGVMTNGEGWGLGIMGGAQGVGMQLKEERMGVGFGL